MSAGTDAELNDAADNAVRASAVPSVVDWLSTPSRRTPSSAPLLPSCTLRAVTDSVPVPTPVASQCANKTCPAGFFCANGDCLPAVAQCKPADPTCIFIPHGAFEPPEHAWWWPFTSALGPDDPVGNSVRKDLEFPDFVEVMSTPIVMRLHAADTEPAVVFNSFALEGTGGTVESRGVMRAIRGSDGSPIWSAPKDFWNAINVIGAVDGNASIAAGDCKGDGHVCFITGGWDS